MIQKRHSTTLLAAALTALLGGGVAGASGLVLCSGTNGHRAIELEHSATGCPTLASTKGATSVSVQPPAECRDVPAVGTGTITPLSFDAARVPTPPLVFVMPIQEPTPRIEMRLSASADTRAGPPDLAVHLRSTVLLV